MRTPEEIEAAILEIAQAGYGANECGDSEMARYAIRMIQCLQWARGDDNDFEEYLRDCRGTIQ